MNELRQTIQNELDERQNILKEEKLNQQLAEETIDVTLPLILQEICKTVLHY